jgi:hypothetical protein
VLGVVFCYRPSGMLPQPRPNLLAAHMTLCEDAFFAIIAAERLDVDMLRALALRRAKVTESAARGGAEPRMDAGEAWILPLCVAIAPIAPPHWMPMADTIAEGLSLEHGARGMRSLFTSKPSDKEIARVRTLGAFAVRALGAVLASTGSFHAEARLTRACFIASLGLPEEDQRKLCDEAPTAAQALEFPSGVEPKLARAILRGGFHAAMLDGMDPREEAAVTAIAGKLGVAIDDVSSAHTDARHLVDSARAFGNASVDAIRYLLGDTAADSERLAIAAVRLSLPIVHRHEAVATINVGAPVTLAKKHPLDRRQRHAVLGLAWVAALCTDPAYVRRIELAARHNQVAADLGEEGDAQEVRAQLDRHFEDELCALMRTLLV